ncbi:hypothetical protein CVT26_006782 [Gymnopilus dilepis]|uniref:Uncharacterized protein n=1 Tax=Gymnopilus dilepis TaxID=231916 RepID=A0A409Y315_9AGAR|nr:hypothetical protein CVT26_006782 [Gymnopilus dilepis]
MTRESSVLEAVDVVKEVQATKPDVEDEWGMPRIPGASSAPGPIFNQIHPKEPRGGETHTSTGQR